MVYITISEKILDESNAWVKENLDFQGGEKTFVVNKKDKSGNGFCLISLPDDGSPFVEGMKKHFGYTDYMEGAYNTRGITKERAESTELKVEVAGKLETVDRVKFISELVDNAVLKEAPVEEVKI